MGQQTQHTFRLSKSQGKAKYKPIEKPNPQIQETVVSEEVESPPVEEKPQPLEQDSKSKSGEIVLDANTSFSAARTANEILKAKTQQLKYDELKKELVNRQKHSHMF